MKTKLYISNLSRDTTEAELHRHFSMIGKVASVAIVRGRYSRQSKGLALVEMETENEMRLAIKALNGLSLRGSVMGVSSSKNSEAWIN